MIRLIKKVTIAFMVGVGVLFSQQFIDQKFQSPQAPELRVEATANDFILEYVTTAANQQVYLAFNGATNVLVDWNDGTPAVSRNAGGDMSKTYAVAGTYQVKITGSLTGFGIQSSQFSYLTQSNGRLKSVIQWGSTGVTSLSGAFAFANNLTFIPNTLPTTVTNLSFLFRGKTNWTEPLTNIASWNLINVTNVSSMFASATNFNLNIDAWNVSNVTNFSTMFASASNFNQPLNSWNTSKATNFSGMFSRASKFNQPLNNWQTGSVINFSNMFDVTPEFNQDISSWNTGSGTNFMKMFWAASKFNSPLNTWNMSNATTIQEMFQDANAFDKPLGDWDVSKVTNFTGVFYVAQNFNQNIDTWDVSSGTNFNSMFYLANKFNQPLNSWDVSKATSMSQMFRNTAAFNQPLNQWNVSNVTNFNNMFSSSNFDQDIGMWNVSKGTNFSEMFSSGKFNQNIGNWNVSEGTSFSGMFQFNSLFNQNINNWNVSKAISMMSMFRGATAYNQPLSNWNVSNVTNMERMFDGASIFNQDITGWNTGKVTNMYGMFNGARKFNQNISIWDVSKVTQFGQMFSYTDDFNQPIGVWNTSNAVGMSEMFSNAKAFNLYIGEWDTSKVTNMAAMFSYSIFNQDISGWSTGEVIYTYDMFAYNLVFDQPIGDWNVAKLINMDGMFRNSIFNQPIGSWNTVNVNTMYRLFQNNKVFNQPIGTWNVAKVQYFRETFQGAEAFNQDLPWTTTALTLVWNMFDGAKAFNGDVSTWTMTGVTDLGEMFQNANSFNQPINSWNVTNVVRMNRTFRGASSFNQPLNLWNTGKVTELERTFENATAFNQNIGAWDFSKVVTMADFMGGSVNLNPLNYDAILTKLSNTTMTLNTWWGANGLSFGQSKYSKVAKALKDSLIATRSWTIIDGGELRLTIDVNDEEIYFGEADPTFSVSYTGLVTGAGEDTLTNNFVFTRAPGTAVGNYTVSVTGGDESYYYVSYSTGTLAIVKPSIDVSSVTWNYSDPLVYTGTAQTVTLVGVPALVTVTYLGNSATNAGTYTASVTLSYDTANYELVGTIAPLTWVIDKADYDMSGVSWTYTGTPFTYDITEKTITVTGLPTGVTVASYEENSATAPGTYTASVIFQYDSANFNEPILDEVEWAIFAATYTITFDSRGGTNVSSIAGILGSDITAPANPTRSGYLFNGWSQVVPSTMPNQNLTLTAAWIAVNSNPSTTTDLSSIVNLDELNGEDGSLSLVIDLIDQADITEEQKASILEAYQTLVGEGSIETLHYEALIQLLQGNDNIIIETIDGVLTLTLVLPEEVTATSFTILMLVDGEWQAIETTYDEGARTIRFNLPAVGSFVVAYEVSAFSLPLIASIAGGILAFLGMIWFFLLGKKRRKKEPKETVVSDVEEEEESMEDKTFFAKSMANLPLFYESLTQPLQVEFKSLFVDATPQHVVKELTYIIGERNEAFFKDVYRFIYRYRKLITLPLLTALIQYGLDLAVKDPVTQSYVYEAGMKAAYGKRANPEYMSIVMLWARKDIALQRDVLNPRKKFVYSFYRLAIILEKQKAYKEALVIINEGIARELIDRAKQGYAGRLEKINTILEKQQGK